MLKLHTPEGYLILPESYEYDWDAGTGAEVRNNLNESVGLAHAFLIGEGSPEQDEWWEAAEYGSLDEAEKALAKGEGVVFESLVGGKPNGDYDSFNCETVVRIERI